MTVQPGLCRTWKEPKFLVYSQAGSTYIVALPYGLVLFTLIDLLQVAVPATWLPNLKHQNFYKLMPKILFFSSLLGNASNKCETGNNLDADDNATLLNFKHTV